MPHQPEIERGGRLLVGRGPEPEIVSMQCSSSAAVVLLPVALAA
jgi:hypothetical protein